MTPAELSGTVLRAVCRAVDDGELSVAVPERVVIERPGPGGCGDYASNVALQLASAAGAPPRRVAEILRDRILRDRLYIAPGIAGVEITGPGFLNFTLDGADAALVRDVLTQGLRYGHSLPLDGRRVDVRIPAHELRAEVVADAVSRIVAALGGHVDVVHVPLGRSGEPVGPAATTGQAPAADPPGRAPAADPTGRARAQGPVSRAEHLPSEADGSGRLSRRVADASSAATASADPAPAPAPVRTPAVATPARTPVRTPVRTPAVTPARTPVNLHPVPAPPLPVTPLTSDATRWALLHPAAHDHPRLTTDHLVQRESNPLFRVQYAHSRALALVRGADDLGFHSRPGRVDDTPEVGELLTVLADYPVVLATAARNRAPDRLARHLVAIADAFFGFHDATCVLPLGDEKPSAAHRARLALAEAAGTVLAGGLSLLGIDAPEHV